MGDFITGIQQCGIGTYNVKEAALYYKDLLGMDALVFDDTASASLMKAYTGDKVFSRRAMLTMNMQGGGGLELWQFTNRQPLAPAQIIRLGDLGIFAIKIKCPDVPAAFKHFMHNKAFAISPIQINAAGDQHFWLTDKYGHVFNMVKAREIFKDKNKICGGVCGAVIGVSSIQRSLLFYKNFLGLHTEVYHTLQKDLGPVHYSNEVFETVLLQKPPAATGAFSNLLGSVEIELVQANDYTPNKIYANRYWGDIGFIHLCFDVLDMDELKKKALNHSYHFTVDSKSSFNMQDAGGRFCYVEDPDGTLIELVETHKVPVIKKLGLYINLKKRRSNKRLPGWIINMLGLSKVK